MGRKNKRRTSQQRAIEIQLDNTLAYGNYDLGLNRVKDNSLINEDVKADAEKPWELRCKTIKYNNKYQKGSINIRNINAVFISISENIVDIMESLLDIKWL